jgi:hypothetical protein
MSHSEDLSPNKYFGRWQDILVSVGWLDNGHDYPRGAVPLDFFRALVRLLEDPWQPGVFAGRAPCSICQFSGGPGSLAFEGKKIQLGSANLFVPSREGKVFVCPSLVAHYIDAHGYAPPEEFQEAVLECPPMGSLPYRRALHERGLRAVGAE